MAGPIRGMQKLSEDDVTRAAALIYPRSRGGTFSANISGVCL